MSQACMPYFLTKLTHDSTVVSLEAAEAAALASLLSAGARWGPLQGPQSHKQSPED